MSCTSTPVPAPFGRVGFSVQGNLRDLGNLGVCLSEGPPIRDPDTPTFGENLIFQPWSNQPNVVVPWCPAEQFQLGAQLIHRRKCRRTPIVQYPGLPYNKSRCFAISKLSVLDPLLIDLCAVHVCVHTSARACVCAFVCAHARVRAISKVSALDSFLLDLPALPWLLLLLLKSLEADILRSECGSFYRHVGSTPTAKTI